VEYLQSHPETGMVYGDCSFIDAAGSRIGRFSAAQTDYRRLRQGYVHIPQQASFWRADLWRQVGPLDPTFYFAMDYDLWVRLAKITKLDYNPRYWANFRLHGSGKTVVSDDRCWPEMLRVHYRDGGSLFSLLAAKYALRKVVASIIRWRRRRLFSSKSETL
jgi:hypothetical protein